MTTNTKILKMCMLGDGGVGKTTFIERIVSGKFNSNTKMTIGVDFQVIHKKIIRENMDPVNLTISVWDLGGEHQFRIILPSYITGANGGLLLFDAARYATTKDLHEWVELWRNHTKKGTPLYLIASKMDKLEPHRKYPLEREIELLKKRLQIETHFCISSKTGENIEEVIDKIARDMVKHQ